MKKTMLILISFLGSCSLFMEAEQELSYTDLLEFQEDFDDVIHKIQTDICEVN